MVWLGFAVVLAHKGCSSCQSVMSAPGENGCVKVMSEGAGAENPSVSHGGITPSRLPCVCVCVCARAHARVLVTYVVSDSLSHQAPLSVEFSGQEYQSG